VFGERNAMEVDIDNAPPDFSQGDEVAITSVLTKRGERAGRFDGHVMYTYVNFDAGMVRAILNATASLPKGEIEVQGVATFRMDTAEFNFAVVGGTRRYEGVSGEFHLVEDGDAVRYVFDLEDD
jgi:allene oxide cyclase-like protein